MQKLKSNKTFDKKISYKDFFLRYPHKCKELNPESKTVPLPYFPSSEVDCEHPYALDYKEYKTILQSYFTKVFHFLRTGHIYKMYSRLGYLEFFRFSGATVDNEVMRTRKKRFRTQRNHINDDVVAVRWNKKKSSRFKYNKFWIVHLTKTAWVHAIKNYYEADVLRLAKLSKR